MYVCMCTRMYMNIHEHVCEYVHVQHVHGHGHVHVFVHVHVRAYVHAGDYHPSSMDTFLRPTLDTGVSTDTTLSHITYNVNIVRGHGLWQVNRPGIPIHGNYYSPKWFKPATVDGYAYSIEVPISRKCGCNFEQATKTKS